MGGVMHRKERKKIKNQITKDLLIKVKDFNYCNLDILYWKHRVERTPDRNPNPFSIKIKAQTLMNTLSFQNLVI